MEKHYNSSRYKDTKQRTVIAISVNLIWNIVLLYCTVAYHDCYRPRSSNHFTTMVKNAKISIALSRFNMYQKGLQIYLITSHVLEHTPPTKNAFFSAWILPKNFASLCILIFSSICVSVLEIMNKVIHSFKIPDKNLKMIKKTLQVRNHITNAKEFTG